MRKLLILAILMSSFCFKADVCSAGEFSQKDGAFTINVLDGWKIESKEEVGEVILITPKAKEEDGRLLKIGLQRRLDPARGVNSGAPTPQGVKEDDLLDYSFKQAVGFLKSGGSKATITSQEKIMLDGRPAYKIDVILDFRANGGAVNYSRMYGLITRDFLYGIIISSWKQDRKSEMEQMVHSIKIKG